MLDADTLLLRVLVTDRGLRQITTGGAADGLPAGRGDARRREDAEDAVSACSIGPRAAAAAGFSLSRC